MNSPLKANLKIVALVFAFIGFSVPLIAVGSGLSCKAVFRAYYVTPRNFTNPHSAVQVENYLEDTIHSFERMRGKNGLVRDTIWVHAGQNGEVDVRALNPNTSPTNIAIDLLIQTDLISRGEGISIAKSAAKRNLSKVLSTLGALRRHASSGLFFSWYSTETHSAVENYNLSSIDNIHLALALWTIKETFPDTALAEQATALLEPMNFSMFYDESSGLIGGNFSYVKGEWVRDLYNFGNLGTEARILYSAGWALGLFKNESQNSDFIAKAFGSLQSEVEQTQEGPILKLWDGSAFQLYFPKMFVSEELYSPALAKMYSADANYMIDEGLRRHLPVPAAHSAGVVQVVRDSKHKMISIYNDKAGDKDLVSSANKDVSDPRLEKNWDQTFTPYALFMAATSNPDKFLPIFSKVQDLKSENTSLYVPGMGWLDGLHLSGKLAGQVVPAQLAVNQGMIALSLLQMEAKDGLSASGRALQANPKVRQRMKIFYKFFDEKMKREGIK